MRSLLDPVVLEPRLVPKVWGGDRLGPMTGVPAAAGPHGEAWCFSTSYGRGNRVVSGPFRGQTVDQVLRFWHDECRALPREAPVIIKLLESVGPLSIQVHPSDEVAASLGGDARGKAEAWWILDADPGAEIFHGLRPDVDLARLELTLARDPAGVPELCRRFPAKAGQLVPVPPGTIHGVRGRVMWVEVQQASDTTYRLHDWGRGDPARPLQVEPALRCLRHGLPDEAPRPAPAPGPDGRGMLWDSPWFRMERRRFSVPASMTPCCDLEVITVVRGQGRLQGRATTGNVRPGSAVMVSRLGGPLRFFPEEGLELVVTHRLPGDRFAPRARRVRGTLASSG